ncbi:MULTISPECIES: pesticin C-terminus-like muramidase [unclassified Acinetobacter]|uniref:pesticin C-terminus-like muramidase n=1 Tax=unclassified Acinetobacter TaxID=196816 RepID=UPI0020B37BED|nr:MULTISPECIES: pesticin C-terminus-like muramidase [unclassified Acinetobacter]
MSNLVTITSKIYDASGTYVINLKVKSRYKGSSRENINKTDKDGLFIFQGSPNRTVEILAKPPNVKDYIVIKTIDSSIISSRKHPVKVFLPKSIEEYQQEKAHPDSKGTVTTLFKIIDCEDKILINFPVKSRPKGKQSSFERHTNEQGIVEVLSSPNRDIEILVLTSNDGSVLKGSINSENGSQIPKIIKLDEPYESFKSESTVQIVDREGNNYIIENTKVEIFYLESDRKEIIKTSNGKFSFQSIIGEKIQLTVFKPDGTPLKSENYLAKKIKGNALKLELDVDIINDSTKQNKPTLDKNIKEFCKAECIVETYTFETSLGAMVISKESLDSILKWEKYESKPYVPSKGKDGKSGVTLGYGYDLGHQNIEQIKKDLASYYTSSQIQRLLKAQGKKGLAAQTLVNSLSDIIINKDKAYQMVMIVKKRYAEDTLKIYRDILKYHPHCQGAILSLVYNRYIGLKGDRRKEMKEIQNDLKNNGKKVPSLLRSMKRLWTTKANRGLQARREDEAKIFEKGLKCECYK